MDQVAEWCRVGSGGACIWDVSVGGLRDALQNEFDVIDLEGDWDGVREAVEANDEPVIATIANPNPLLEFVGDHAVVIYGIEANESQGEQVVDMDPSTGTHESKQLEDFLQWWTAPGRRAFIIRP